MFIDQAEIYIKAGNGGNGAISFRREKYVAKGGPDGGDGGDGGSINFLVDNHCHGLAQYNREKSFHAENGQNGMGAKKSGKKGEDLTLRVPAGTQIYHKGEMMADLLEEGSQITLVKGGIGGWGNFHFKSSIKQAPTWSKDGLKGESMKIQLELKSIADVGLVGLPNAGKSTLLSVLSNAHPKIANYPFTTLEPNLGTIKNLDRNIIIADIPGLIEGASKGKGLGDKFLKHIERTKIILHLIDANSIDPYLDYKTVRQELSDFSKSLAKKKELIVINKIDSINEDKLDDILKTFKSKKKKVLAISAATNGNIDKLIETIKKLT